RVSEVFRHIFVLSAKFASLATADSINADQMEDFIVTYRGLSEFEKKMFGSIGQGMRRTELDRDLAQISPLFQCFSYLLRHDQEITNELASSTSTSVFQLLLKKLNVYARKHIMRDDKVPEEAVQEFFENGLLNPPYNKDTFESIKEWAGKWSQLPNDQRSIEKMRDFDFEVVRTFQSEIATYILWSANRLYG
ncbi:hypothetical protein PFISCL1PPCAC_7034, partial [Pristionchus fissidentatus]